MLVRRHGGRVRARIRVVRRFRGLIATTNGHGNYHRQEKDPRRTKKAYQVNRHPLSGGAITFMGKLKAPTVSLTKPRHLALGRRQQAAALNAFAGHSLAQAKDGYLWIGTQNELLRFDGARFETFYEGQAVHWKWRSWS